MELKYKIVVECVTSSGSKFNIQTNGKGDNVDFNLAYLKVSNKIWSLVIEELSVAFAEYKSINK